MRGQLAGDRDRRVEAERHRQRLLRFGRCQAESDELRLGRLELLFGPHQIDPAAHAALETLLGELHPLERDVSRMLGHRERSPIQQHREVGPRRHHGNVAVGRRRLKPRGLELIRGAAPGAPA
jgi:hypothetical protein